MGKILEVSESFSGIEKESGFQFLAAAFDLSGSHAPVTGHTGGFWCLSGAPWGKQIFRSALLFASLIWLWSIWHHWWLQ